MVFCDVGQGDATLFSLNQAQILVDAGPSGKKVLDCLADHMPYWDKKLELVILSHFEADHMGGLDEVLDKYEVDKMLVSDKLKENEEVRKLVELIDKEGVEVIVADAGEELKLGELRIRVLWPENEGLSFETVESERVLGASASLNDESVVAEIGYGEFEVLMTGDIGAEQELAIESGGLLRQVEILKIAHHGSKFSTSSELLYETMPKESVIMVGENNNYGHPNGDVLKRIDMVGSSIRRTDLEGVVEIVSDGKRWWNE